MPTTYVECPECGKRALSVATRCPHCGFHFPPRPVVRPSQPPLGAGRGMLAIAGAVLALVVVALVVRRGPAAPEHTTAAPTDTAPVSARPVTADHTARPKAEGVSPAAAGGVPGPAPVSAPSPMTGAGLRRYAQTWVNVRGDRTRSAPTVGMLNPGDAVTVDSLVHGWYRVLVDGRALGYVHRSTLDVSRPE